MQRNIVITIGYSIGSWNFKKNLSKLSWENFIDLSKHFGTNHIDICNMS